MDELHGLGRTGDQPGPLGGQQRGRDVDRRAGRGERGGIRAAEQGGVLEHLDGVGRERLEPAEVAADDRAGQLDPPFVARWSPRSTVYSGLPRDRPATSVEHRPGQRAPRRSGAAAGGPRPSTARRASSRMWSWTTMRSSSIGTDSPARLAATTVTGRSALPRIATASAAGRRRVEPLQVVDGQQHRRRRRHRPEHVAQRRGDVRPGAGQRRRRLAERHGHGAALHVDQLVDRPGAAATAAGSSSRPTATPARPR